MSDDRPEGVGQGTLDGGGGGGVGEDPGGGSSQCDPIENGSNASGHTVPEAQSSQLQQQSLHLEPVDNDGDASVPLGVRISPHKRDQVTRVEKMLYSTHGSPIIVSEDCGLFQLVMAECSEFEATKQSHEMGKRLLATLIERFHDTFKRDFLFYIALAYRAGFVQRQRYQSKALEEFVDSCIVKFGELDTISVAKALNGFFERENFDFYCNMNLEEPQQQTQVNANWFLEHAFDRLMKERKMLPSHYKIYPTMLWITAYLSFCAKRPAEEADEKKWHYCFLKDAHQYILNEANIEGLEKALSLGQALQLPAKLTFSTSLIGELLAPTDNVIVRPFCEQRDAIKAVEKHFPSEEEFLKCIVVRLREAYKKSLQEQISIGEFLKAVTKKGSTPQAIKDGLSLLDTLLNVIKKSLQQVVYKDFQQWILLLLNVTGHSIPLVQAECLEEFLSQQYSVTRKYRNYIIEQTRMSLKGLPVNLFYRVFRHDPTIWSSENLEEYLHDYSIKQRVIISERYWKDFFEIIIEKFPGAAKQKSIHKFVMRVADCYQKCGKQSQLIVDLLKLGVSGLYAKSSFADKQVATEFENELRVFIRKNGLKNTLIGQTKEMMVCISMQNSFQEVILAATVKEMITDSRDLIEPSLSTAIDTAVHILTCDQTWVQRELSLKQKFCFDFVNTWCSIFSNRFDCIQSVDWIKGDRYNSLINTLGRIYHLYSQSRQVQTQTKPCDPLSAMNPSSIVQSYFNWIERFHLMLKNWKLKLQEKTASYEEIDWYFQNQQNLCKFADIIAAASLVVSEDEVKSLKDVFFYFYRRLNELILRYISGDPKSGWCSVDRILSDYETGFPQHICTELSVNVIFPDKTEEITIAELADIPTPIGESFNPPTEHVCLRLSKNFTLNSLCRLVDQITAFLAPVQPNMGLLIYFKLHPSYLFSTHMHYVLSTTCDTAAEITPEQVQIAVDQTKVLLVKVLEGNATYGEIIANGHLNLEKLNVEEEFSNLLECQTLHKYGGAGLIGIKSLLKLIQFTESILILEQVFKQYDLECCLNDPHFKKISKLALKLQDSEERAKVNIDDAKLKWKMVHEALCLKEDANPKCLEIFSKLAESADFYHFLKERKLTGTLFHHKVEVITRHQELDAFEQTVLNHLIAAYTFIAPFMDSSHKSLRSLMSAVKALNLPEGLPQLETVRKYMYLIQFWFSYSEDTLENVSSELKGILESGKYHIKATTPAISGKSNLQLVIQYKLPLVSTSYKTLEDQPTHETQKQAEKEIINRTLTTEQIDDLVYKLELMKGEDQNVQKFLCLNEVAYKLLEVFSKLQDLGHPKLVQKTFTYTVQCSALLPVEVSVNDTVLDNWIDEVGKWMNEVEKLHSSNKWILFFRVPKLVVLYEALTADQFSVPTIIHEIAFLFKRNAHTSERFRGAVEIAVETSRQDTHSERSPIGTVGTFLECLFDHSEIKKWSLPVRYNKKDTQPVDVLYTAARYTHSQLVQMILQIYGGPPEAFEFLHCKQTTTQQELMLFIKRAIQHPRLYLVVEVNNLPYQLQEVLLQLYLQMDHQKPGGMQTRVYFIETAPSLLREVSYLKFIEHREKELCVDAYKTQKETGLQINQDLSIELVHGMPGNGKTHYIRDKMKKFPENHQVTISVNEAFTTVSVIERLRALPRDASNCAIFFNFTVLPPMDSTDELEKQNYQQLMEDVRWFFFELLILGYVEDPATGFSFHVPANLSWALYIEVPSSATCTTSTSFLERFQEEVPALALLGTPVHILPDRDYYIDDDVQLVCKYLRVYENRQIDIYDIQGEIKFSTDPELSDAECKRLLQEYMPSHVKERKITQKLFIQYMKRRCTVLDNLPVFNFNSGFGEFLEIDGQRQETDTRQLGSTLMQAMLKEVTDFCDPKSQKTHQQLIYDFSDGGASIGLISLLPDDPKSRADKDKFMKIGVETLSVRDLHSRAVLDKYLSRALGVPLSKDGRLSPIDERQYVLTLDYTLKMLNIHERYECGVPVIIEGETGVGKTALIEMLSELWNHSWIAQWDRDKDRIMNLMRKRLVGLDTLSQGEEITEEILDTVAQLPDTRYKSGQFYSRLNQSLLKLEGDLIFTMLNLKLNTGENLADVFDAIKTNECSKSTAHLLYIIFSATVKSAFHKKNIHADLQPNEIEEFFEEVFLQADELQQAYDSCVATKRPVNHRVPFVIAYLDEINTASCLGLFKEIIIDRTINGKQIPQNVFIIASCNPHRGDCLTIMHEKDPGFWLKGTYYVRKFHPTLDYLKWDYGSLNEQQEEEYVNEKMQMLSRQSVCPQADVVPSLTALIVISQQKMRGFALEQLQSVDVPSEVDWLERCAKSSVSQRDILRVFTFYQWLMKTYIKYNPHNESPEMHSRRAVLVSLGIVYFMRLNSKYRSKYRRFLDTYDQLGSEVTFSKAYKDELRWYINKVKLPPNIAKTEALMENVFATIACTMTRTPLIIVGDPGSSKTLSFSIIAANLKGKESKIETFRDTNIFQSLDPHFYQCSRRTTSNEVEKTFKKAINRQHSLAKSHLPILCVVFMDEAGLPEEKHESLKVLHYYLDKQEVSFVAISNHVLDASKTNRAVSLFRPKPTKSELYELAKVSIVPADRVPSMNEEKLLNHFCNSYDAVVCLNKLFGLRDFIHFVIYLRCKRKYLLDAQLILEALERNFNGSESFQDIWQIFFEEIPVSFTMDKIHFRSILDILKDSQTDYPVSKGDDIHKNIQSEVRYKLIIDPSEDDSLVRLLFTYGVLQRENTRLYICSDFPGDTRSRVNTVVQIMHSVAVGHTILMCQTDEIHESFYDLFNQRFQSINDPNYGTRYYTNVAIGTHSRLCHVNPEFRCIVVIKKSDVEDTPPPFLNRFEKYYLTHQSLLETVLSKMPYNLRIVLKIAHNKAAHFISSVKRPNLYGCTEETLDSLMLTLLPLTDYKYIPLLNQKTFNEEIDKSENIQMFLLKLLLKMLRKNAGFNIPQLLAAEIQEDANHIFKMILENASLKETMAPIAHHEAAAVIDEALDVLHHGPEPIQKDTSLKFEVHTDSLMVITVLMQWLVNYLCKKLMQLVPPEAIPVHCNGIPTVYIRNYLVFQEHFSLKELMEGQLHRLGGNDWDRSVCPTKLLCFTRSSPLIYQLPSEHPITATGTPAENYDDFVSKHIFTDQEMLMVRKVSLGYSQDKMEKLLLLFTDSKHQVLLLIANMHELTKKMVNHLRIMIEEAESKMGNKNKLFVLLLHFPPMMFFNPCYPSLFLQGWSHHYLDTVARGLLTREGVKSVVDIKKCFYQCCFPDSHSDFEGEEDQMSEALEELLPEAIPIIASQVAFTCGGNGGTPFVMNASQRTEVLQKFFNRNTGSESIGRILAVKFCKYWTPQLMIQQIEQVSRSVYAQDSTLNITDSVQSIVRSAFFDFLVYMFTRISENHHIDTFIESKNRSPVIEQLFLGLFRGIKVPELAQLKILSATPQPQQVRGKAKKFPFFKYVCEEVEKVIDESREDVNQQFNILDPSASFHPTQKRTKQKMEKLYMKVVMKKIKGRLEGCLGMVVRAMDEDTLWKQYFDDFVTYKLHLEFKPSALTKEIIDAYIISPLKHVHNDALTRIVSLHVCFHVHHLDLTKVTRILRPLSKVQEEKETLSLRSIDPAATLTSQTGDSSQPAAKMPPNLASLIVTRLFNSISNMDAAASESLQYWHRSYCDIISMPAMVEKILSNLTSQTEAQLNIMHAAYLTMQCCYEFSSQRGHQVFTALHHRQGTARDLRTHLREVVDTGLTAMEISLPSQSEKSYCLQSFLEGLFSFFFSKHRISFAEEDCKYFLEIANHQNITFTTQAIGVVKGDTCLHNCISVNVFKFYLARILGEPEHGSRGSQTQEVVARAHGHSELFHLNSKYRGMIGKVLAAHSDFGSPGPYIPTFYQLRKEMHIDYTCNRNALMQQPLAHLYFLTVLEHLQNRRHHPNHLVRLARKIDGFQEKESTPFAEKILLSVEKQAVVQMLIFQVSTFFDSKDPAKIHSLFNTHLNEGVNPLFSDESMGGSSSRASWHALVFAMHLQKQLNDPWELNVRLLDDHSTLVKAFNIVKPLQSLNQPLDQPKDEVHLFSFLKDNSELADFYKRICQAMSNIRESETNQEYITPLIKLVKESEHKMKFTTSGGNDLMINQKNAFTMLMWLCVYNEFYVKKIHLTKTLTDTLSKELRCVLEPKFVLLLESFICPEYMILLTETSSIYGESAEGFQETVRLSKGGEIVDPIGKLFNCLDSQQDPSKIELCHSMANMVAIVLACEPESNHLWYHLFATDELHDSHMTGFMYPDKISGNLPYDCGVELSSDGMYGRPDYLPYATRGTLSLHSLYFLLWANFSAFCMALVTQPDAHEMICGPILSPWRPVRRYCVEQLCSVWLHMGDKLSLSPKEQSFFIMQCMERLLEVSIAQPSLIQMGRFETPRELNTYERTWHEQIFKHSIKSIHDKFAEHCHLHESKLFQSIRCLETYYPHFPTMDEFTQTMLSSADISSLQNKLYVLSIFALEHRHLQVAGALLPDLLELYHWIHNELAYLVTYEDAKNRTIQEVIENGNEMFAGLDLIQVYERVKDGYNSYRKVIGCFIGDCAGARQRVNEIKDSTKFVYFLSVESGEEQGEGSDLLYLVINNIIEFHNSFLRRVFDAINSSQHSSLRKYFPEKLEESVYSTEVNDDVMIVPRKSSKAYEVEEQLQMVRSRFLLPTEQTAETCPFDLHHLQNDVIQAYLVGKPLISPEDVRMHFKFRIERSDTLALEGADLDLSVISQGIEKEFRLQIKERYVSELLCEFHTVDHQLLTEVVRGLKVTINYLKGVHLLIADGVELKSKKLPEFLLLVFKEAKKEILEDIGIKHLSPSQLACLRTLELPYVYSTLELFVNWLKDGVYDFHKLPLAMKKHLDHKDAEVLDKLITSYKGTPSALLQEIQVLTDDLVKYESFLKNTIAENMLKSIKMVLKETKQVNSLELIPDTVLCQHYVGLRVTLRRKVVDLQSSMDAEDHKQDQEFWEEQVKDLWTAEKLKHLWDVAKPYDYSDRMFEFNPAAGEYGLYGYQVEAAVKVHVPEKLEEEEEDKKKLEPEPIPILATYSHCGAGQPPQESIPVTEGQLKEMAKKLSIEDIATFLKSLQLEKYIQLFKENGVSGSLLFDCDLEELKDLGITNAFHRKKITIGFKGHLEAKLSE